MLHLHGSYNSRYFVCHEDKNVSLYRDESLIWQKAMSFSRFMILGVSNMGNVSLLSEEGLYIYPQAADSSPEFIQRYSRDALQKKSTLMGKILISDEGDKFFIECIAPRRGGIDKIFASKAREGTKAITINLMDLSHRRHLAFYEHPLPGDQEKKIFWSASRMFTFFVVAEPKVTSSQTTYSVSIINTASEELYKAFEVKSPHVVNAIVNDEGTALVEVLEPDARKIEIQTVSGDHHTLSVPEEYEVLYLGRRLVAFKSHPVPAMMVKTFEDNLLCQADLRAMDELNIQYKILFDIKEGINFLYLLDRNLKIVKTEIEHFIAEAKRWRRLADEVRARPLRETEEAQQLDEKRAVKQESSRQKQDELGGELRERLVEKKSLDMQSSHEQEKSLEEIKLQFILGAITEDEYMRRKGELEGGAPEAGMDGGDAARKPVEMDAPRRSSRSSIPEKLELKPLKKEPSDEPLPPSPGSLADMPAPQPAEESDNEAEARRLETLLGTLEERFIMGQVTEQSYTELREKYNKKLGELRGALPGEPRDTPIQAVYETPEKEQRDASTRTIRQPSARELEVFRERARQKALQKAVKMPSPNEAPETPPVADADSEEKEQIRAPELPEGW